MTTEPMIKIQTGPNPWNEEEERHVIQEGIKATQRQEGAKRKGKDSPKDEKEGECKRKKKACAPALSNGASTSAHDAIGTVPSETALKNYERLLKNYEELRVQFESMRKRYQLLRNHLTSGEPSKKRLKMDKEEEEEEEEEKEWFFVLARL